MILKRRFRSLRGFFLVLPVFEATALLVAGIIDELSEDDCPRRRQRTPRPPEVQRDWDARAGSTSRASTQH